MGTAELLQRFVTFAIAAAAIAAVVAYLRGQKIAALALNTVSPLLILCAGALALLQPGSQRVTLGGILFFVLQALALVATAMSILRRSPNAALFWIVWTLNLSTFSFLVYLVFFFHIF